MVTLTGGLNGARPLLTTSDTAAPFARWAPAAMPCEMTRPVRTVDEKRLVMVPVLQCAACRLAEAATSVLPFTAGTTQTGGGGGGDVVVVVVVGGGVGGGELAIGNGPSCATELAVPLPSSASRCSHQELPGVRAGLASAVVLAGAVGSVAGSGTSPGFVDHL